MEIRVLGAVEVVSGDGAMRAVALQQRRLLAALAIHIGKVRSSDVLIEALWGEQPPVAAEKALQVYVSRLRKQLPASARIHTRGGGYALEVEGDALDAVRFERLLSEGRETMEAGNPALALSLLRRALALWRGPAYGEFRSEEFAHGEAERLEELRLVALEERIDAELILGSHTELLPELRTLAAERPWRERLQAQLMLALYRGGRQSEALDVYAGTRARLRNELGLEPGEELRELQRRILQQDPALAPARGPEAAASELPASPNRLLGRERELRELRDLLRREDVRLLVLSGAGGTGKTRLALEAAREAAGTFANGTAFIDLEPLRDPNLVLPAIARGLGMRQLSEQSFETIAPALRRREMLLLLDNAEHLLAAAPSYVELLAQAPHLKLLVTSRAVLHLSGEHVYPVEPLRGEDAVALFCERARAADPRFEFDIAEEEAIRRICTRLDGLPLAIELAASRVRTLALHELLARLEPRLPLLTGGPRDLSARQQTLRATLDWSYELLSDTEQRLLARLAVFAGSFDVATAEAVCGADIDTLQSLMDKSLLRGAEDGRFSMLETVREYAVQRLEERQEGSEMRQRYARHLLECAGSLVEDPYRWNDERGLGDWFEAEHESIRGLLDSLKEEDPQLELHVALACFSFWVFHGYWLEGRRRIEGALQRAGTSEGLRARALADISTFCWRHGAAAAGKTFAQEALELFRATGNELGLADAHRSLAICEMQLGNNGAKARHIEEAEKIARAAGHDRLLSVVLNLRGNDALYVHDFEQARSSFEQALAINRRIAWNGEVANVLEGLGFLALAEGRAADAERLLEETLAIASEFDQRDLVPWAVAGLAAVAVEAGSAGRAAKLLASASTLVEELGMSEEYFPIGIEIRDRTIAAARARLGEVAFEEEWTHGRALDYRDAVEYALGSESDAVGPLLAATTPGET